MKDGDRLIVKAKWLILAEWGLGLIVLSYSHEQWAIWAELQKN